MIGGQLIFQNFLRKRLAELQEKNPSFSLRAFSKKAGLSSGAASEILSGRRKISYKMARKIADHLLLDPQEKHRLLKTFQDDRETPSESVARDLEYLRLSSDQFKLISDWIHYAILSLIQTRDFQSSIQWIASRLDVSMIKVSDALDRMERLGLIQKNEEGRWIRTHARIHTSDGVLDLSIQKAHIQDMEIAKEALKLPGELRDFTSLSMPTSPEALKRAREAIRKFRDELSQILMENPGTEVYQFSAYLYPLTKVRKTLPGEAV